MPGGRLTYDERRRIAAGLAEGLSYSGIAAGLGRPVSTVSREVERNGGPAGYQADDAQLATGLRARRGAAAAPARRADSDADGASGSPGAEPAGIREFTDRFTASMVASGLPRMSARVLACLYTTDSGSLTSAELVGRLHVSPASVSKAVGYLEDQKLIRRERDPRRRAENYVIDNDVWLDAMHASARMNEHVAAMALDGARIVGVGTPAGARLVDLGEFLGHVGRDLAKAAEHRRHILRSGRRPHDPL